MPTAARKPAAKRRTASKESRQLQLIQATIRSVARRGIAGTTLADVAREAGLSQGIINLHFQSKERLLMETLRYLAEEYREAWERALEKAGPRPGDRLAAVVRLDFTPPIYDRRKFAVWFAYWGEAKARPTYRKLCAERDREYRSLLIALCEAIVEDGGYDDVDPEVVAVTLSAMSEGLWLDLLITPQDLDRERAMVIAFDYLAKVFPQHFPPV